MLALRFHACDGCETVVADPGAPPECPACGGSLRDLGDRLRGAPYFAAGLGPD